MRDRIFVRLPATLLLVAFGLIVVHAPLTVFIGTRIPELDIVIKAWKEPLILLSLGLIVAGLVWQKQLNSFRHDILLWVMSGYVMLHIVIALLFNSMFALIQPWMLASLVAGLAIDLRYILFFMAVYLLVRTYPSYRRRFLKVSVIGAIVVVGFALLQQFLPHDILKHIGYSAETIAPYLTVDKNYDFIRINSTLRGPNPLGAYAAIVFVGCVAYVLYRWQELKKQRAKLGLFILLLIGSTVALWTSYSRSAVIAAAIGVAAVLLVRFARSIRPHHVLAIIGVSAAVGVGVYLARDSAFVHNVILHDNPTTGAELTSNTAHAESLFEGTERMLRQPFGAGIGSTGSASLYGDSPLIIENQYLFIAHESGWLGFVLFIAITIVLLRRLAHRHNDWLARAVFASGLGLALICLIQPVWVDDTVSIIWWGLAAIALTKGEKHDRTTNKKTKRAA